MRWIPDQIERAEQRTTLTYRIVPRFSLGVEYNPRVDEVGPLASLVAVTETERRPALILGTSSDRIGTPEGQAYFVTLSKDLENLTGLPLAPYVGLAYGTFDDRLRGVGGLRARIGAGFSSTVIWDGKEAHPTVEYRLGPHAFSFLWIAMEDAGVSYSVVF